MQEEIQGLRESKGALLERIAALDADHEELHRRVSEVAHPSALLLIHEPSSPDPQAGASAAARARPPERRAT